MWSWKTSRRPRNYERGLKAKAVLELEWLVSEGVNQGDQGVNYCGIDSLFEIFLA